jgi:hypothetical protein
MSRFMLWDYYLNGTPRAWEVFREFARPLRGTRERANNHLPCTAMTGGSLRLFAEAYEATWDPEYLSCAHQFADILYGAQAELGTTRYDDVYMNEGKVKYYQITGDERMRDLFVNDMRVLSGSGGMQNVFADTRAHDALGPDARLLVHRRPRACCPTRCGSSGGDERVPTVDWRGIMRSVPSAGPSSMPISPRWATSFRPSRRCWRDVTRHAAGSRARPADGSTGRSICRRPRTGEFT